MGKMYVLREKTEDDLTLHVVGIATCEPDAARWADELPENVVLREYQARPVISTDATESLVEPDPDGAVAKALCELKSAADYIAESGSQRGAGRLHRLADEAADAVGLEITEQS
jgi:hypothetical protein